MRLAFSSAVVFILLASAPLFGIEANVILITIDTLRADYVGCYGSPHLQTPALDSLAKDGVLFETAYCQVPLTPPSHASILTGQYPASHGLRDFTIGQYREGSQSFATILRKHGYSTAAFVSAFVLDESWGMSEGFDLYYDDFDLEEWHGTNPGNVQRRAEETIDKVLSWLDQAKSPFFLWVHLFDPHHDYTPPPPFSNQFRHNPYAGEVAYTDQEIGRLLDRLKKSGLYENSLVVATSDHGEALGEHGENEHGFFLYEAAIRIPLIFKLPASYDLTSPRIETIAQTIDLLPTTLQILRIRQDPSWKIEGRGLLSHILGKRNETFLAYAETYYPQTSFGWSALRLVRQGDHKFIEAPRPELYDVVNDPQEQQNLYNERQPLAHQLKASLQRLEQSFLPQEESASSSPDPESIERLGALGYVSVTNPVRVQDGLALPDPKDKIQIFNRILRGLQAAEAGKFNHSNQILDEVARREPELFIVHYSIGQNYLRMGRFEKALELLDKASELNPDFTSIQVSRAQALAQIGRYEEAFQVLVKVTERDANNLTAQRLLAGIYIRRGDLPAAINTYRLILDRRKDDRLARKALGVALVEQQEYTEGLMMLDGAIALGMDDAQLRNSRGIALANQGRLQEAIQSYRTALELKPDYAQPRLNLAFSLQKAGRKSEAKTEFEKLCQTSPQLCQRYRSRFQ